LEDEIHAHGPTTSNDVEGGGEHHDQDDEHIFEEARDHERVGVDGMMRDGLLPTSRAPEDGSFDMGLWKRYVASRRRRRAQRRMEIQRMRIREEEVDLRGGDGGDAMNALERV
jgi:hypothetical protein